MIVTHRADGLLDACLDSLRRQSRPPAAILVVVSNTPRPIAAPSLQLGENVGFARAANAGFAATTGDVLLLNDDTVLHPDCLAALAHAWTDPGIYQPRILLADGSGLDNLGHGFFPDGFVWARGRNGPPAPPRGVPGGFSGAAVGISRTVWDDLGGFDARFDSYGEDVDLSLRWMRRGGSITPVPAAVVHHHLGATYGRSGADKVRRIERNRVRAAVRSLPASALISMPFWTGARLLAFGALAAGGQGPGRTLAPGAARAALAGLVDGVRDVPEWWGERRGDQPRWARGEIAMWRALWRGRVHWEDVWRA